MQIADDNKKKTKNSIKQYFFPVYLRADFNLWNIVRFPDLETISLFKLPEIFIKEQ